MYVIKRSEHNPVLMPAGDRYWESFATFNLCPVRHGRIIYGLYRAVSAPDLMQTPKQRSVIGVGKSKDGIHFEDRKPFIIPSEEWEKFGCEDPCVTYFEGAYYIFYTALSSYPFSADSIKSALAISRDLKKIDSKHLITPFQSKHMSLFPERVAGKVTVILTSYTDMFSGKICLAQADKIEDFWSESFWINWQSEINKHLIDPRRSPGDYVTTGAPPIKTEYGWLLIYSHIQNYFPSPEKLGHVFGIEALLLDLQDPRKIIGRTKGPILVPGESYELSGHTPNVVFPTGAILEKEVLRIYYGAADTTACVASVFLADLLSSMCGDDEDKWRFKRAKENPIIIPNPEHLWEAQSTFNPAAILLEGKTHILYRAMSCDNTSSIGYASTENGFDILERLDKPIYIPREDFELKKINNANSGCEDPRLTQIGENIYMFYTAYDSIGPPRVAVSSINEKDFLLHKWNWSKPFLITPKGFDEKDTCLLPEKFPDGYFILHRVDNQICGDYLKSLDFEIESVKKCIRILGPRTNAWDSLKVGITAPPIKTQKGWLLLYHGVSSSHGIYRVGAALLDLKDPTIVLSRSTDPIFEPVEQYEKIGIVNNVVFPCGMTVQDGILYIYYGGADKVVGVATIELDIILNALLHGMNI